MEETTGKSLGNETLEENLCILGVPLIQAGANPEGCNLSYTFLFKFFFVSTYVKDVVVRLHVSRLGLYRAFGI